MYKFYLPETPLIFKGHSNTIKRIEWLEDDSGFVSSALDNTIKVWKLNNVKVVSHKDSKKRDLEAAPVWEYKERGVTFTSLATYKPDPKDLLAEKDMRKGEVLQHKHLFYATDTQRGLRELLENEEKMRLKLEQQQNIMQI